MHISNFAEDDVVISGLAIHLPGIDTYEKFAQTLIEGLPLRPARVENVPSGYHGCFPAPGGKVLKTNELDAVFFGMNTAVFNGTDRMQMKGLEICFEALMDSGINSEEVKEFLSEVYMNAVRADGEYADMKRKGTRYIILGYSRAMGPNRVSFHFDHKGHSAALDNGYCGGIRGIELGWRDIKEGRADLAIISSTNLFLSESTTAQLDDLGWLSLDGRTRSFDNEAGGSQRTEGYVAIILQKAKHAKRIYAKLNHVSCEFIQSPSTSLFRPSKDSWVEFLKKTYADSKIPKERIQYLEAYGAAIKEWDAAELNAAMEVFGENRKDPLMVGSVKSNVGHTEGAADLVSIVKGIVCLENRLVPGNMHFKSPNRAVPGLIAGNLKVAVNRVPLNDDALLAINSYSYGNVYGHCILEGFKKPKNKKDDAQDLPRLVLLSSRMDDFFPQILHQIEEEVPFDTEYINLIHELFKADIGQHLAKGYTILPKLQKSISEHQTIDGEKRPLWFVFSGMGSQWPGMGKALMKLPLARASIEKCHNILLSKGLDLIQILTSDEEIIFNDNLNSFVGIAAIQIALVDVLNALKIVADGIIGHSLGEVGCAYADGSLDLEQTILASYYRGKAVKDATLEKGAMAAVGKGYSALKDCLPDNVEVACHNSSTSSTISGLEQPVLQYVETLKNEGVFAKVVEVGQIGFHSRFITPAGPSLLKYMKNVIKEPKLRSTKWISSSVPEANWTEEAALYSSAEYFTNNLLQSVLFEETCSHIPANALLVEIAPHGLLQAIMKRSFPSAVNIPLTSRAAPDNLIFLLQAIGKMYMAGVHLDVTALYPAPNFPVGTKTNSLHKLFPWCTIAKPVDILTNTKRVMNLRALVRNCDETMGEHMLCGNPITPISIFPCIAWHSFYQNDPSNLDKPFLIKDLHIFKPFDLSISHDLTIEAMTLNESHLTEITKDDLLIASAITTKLEGRSPELSAGIFKQKGNISLTKMEIYNALARRGYHIAKNMRYLTSVNWADNGIRGTMQYTNNWQQKLEALLHLVYLNVSRQEERFFVIQKIGKIEVDCVKSDEKQPKGNKLIDLELFYDCSTNELSTSGIYVRDVIYKIYSDSSNLRIQSILPYIQTPLKSIEEYVFYCGQIMSSLRGMDVPSSTKILEVHLKNLPQLSPVIEWMFPNVKVESVQMGRKSDKRIKYDLVVCGNSDIHDYLHEISSYVLIRGIDSKEELLIPKDFSVVSSFVPSKGEKITLIKKRVVLNGEAQFITIPEKEVDLIATLKKCQAFRTNALLVGYKEPSEGALSFIEKVQSKTSMILKWMFILDESAPKFCIEDNFYKHQLEKGLGVNVLLNGSWNFIFKRELDFPYLSKVICVEKEIPRKVVSDDVVKMTPGIDLKSAIPADWNINDREEIAAAYAMAYYCIVMAADSRPYDGVLVTDGGTLIGQAAIAVALSITNRVYATVASPDEVKELQDIFPSLNSSNIILHSDPNFVVKLKDETLNNFPNIIYNNLDGRVAQDLFAFPPPYAKIFHLGKKDIEDNHTLFTSQFLQYVSLIPMSMNNIDNWHIDDKKEVCQLVNEGIKNGVVRPLQAIPIASLPNTYRNQRVQRLVSKCYKENEFEIKSNGNYFVLGENTGIDLEIAEWLIRRGAKNIILYNTSHQNRTDYTRQLSVLRCQRSANLQIFDECAVKKLLIDVKKKSIQLEAVFYIHLVDKEPSREVALINEALSTELNYFMAITRNREFALKMQKYHNPMKSCMNIVWNTEQELIPRNMDGLANLLGEHTFVSIDGRSKSGYSSSAAAIGEWIPSSLESIRTLGSGLSPELQLIELSTSGLSMKSCSAECQPVFIFPGVEEDVIKSTKGLARALLSPAFAVKVPKSDNFKILSASASVLSEILKLIDRKIYNLVGLSTGCILAMEVARQLEQRGKVASLILVDNPLYYLRAPNLKSAINRTILDALMAMSLPETKTAVMDSLSWDLQLNQIVSAMGLRPLTESLIISGVKHICSYLSTVCSYDASDLKLRGPITVLKSDTFTGSDIAYNEICSSSYVVNISMGHRELLRSKELQSVINKANILDDHSLRSVHDLLWVAFEGILEKFRIVEAEEGLEVLW